MRLSEKHKKGFTLIELLVVIAIIALLLSIVMPALRAVKEKARSDICRTNLKNLTLGTLVYVEENDGKTMSYEVTPAYSLWLRQIAPYVGDELDDARYCPSTKQLPRAEMSDPSGFGSSRESWNWTSGAVDEWGSYAMNGWFYTNVPPQDEFFAKVSDVRMTALAPIFGDAAWVDARPKHDVPFNPSPNSNYLETCRPDVLNGMNRFVMDRHGKSINVGFMDGHQDAVELEMLWTLKWNAKFENQGRVEIPR